jgi:hypothetical protein
MDVYEHFVNGTISSYVIEATGRMGWICSSFSPYFCQDRSPKILLT